MEILEEKLENAFVELEISQTNQESIKNYLNILKKKDKDTYEHSIRVGLLGVKIAEYTNLNKKVLFFAGVLHDIGKVLIDSKLLKKTEGFNDKDMEEMKNHPEYAYKMLKGVHEFSAAIALRHHKFQENGYPKEIPDFKIPFSENTEESINNYAKILSLIDSYDALKTRINDKEKRRLREDEVKSLLLNKNSDKIYFIEDLYKNKIFE